MACTVTLFPLSSHSCLPMTSFLQPSKSPSLHTLWWPLSLSVGRRSFTRARQCIRGCSTEGNVTPLLPKINSQYTLGERWGLLGPSPIGGELLTVQSQADNHIVKFMMAMTHPEDIFSLLILWLLHFFPLSSAMFLEPRTGNVDVPFRGKNSTIMGNFFS